MPTPIRHLTAPEGRGSPPKSRRPPARRCARLPCLLVLLLGFPWALAEARAGTEPDVTLACVLADAGQHRSGAQAATSLDDGACGPAQRGVLRLLWEMGRRTSVSIAPVPRAAEWHSMRGTEPLVLWLGSERLAPISDVAKRNLAHFLRSGGTLLVDATDARQDSPFVASVRHLLEELFGPGSIRQVPREHVLFKTFYLVADPVARAAENLPSEGLVVGGRLAAVLLQHDLFGSLAQEMDGSWRHPLSARGERGREMDLRWAINWMMWALCGDYKNDHVHLPFILKRRQ